MTETCRALTIFEGPDGAGKTTLARAYAAATGARYVHMGPFRRVGGGLARLYVEAMTPALLGHRDVVMDRCWLSEKPYSEVFRSGEDRLSVRLRMLERLAYRCRTMVVYVSAPWGVLEAGFVRRRGAEMLAGLEQLRAVTGHYAGPVATELPSARIVTYHDGWRPTPVVVDDVMRIAAHASTPHDLTIDSAGNLDARVVLMWERASDVLDCEPLVQWPAGSLSGADSSFWLSSQLDRGGVGEHQTRWVNVDRLGRDDAHALTRDATTFAIGRRASEVMTDFGIAHVTVEHPKAWRRFHATEPYPLAAMIKETLSP